MFSSTPDGRPATRQTCRHERRDEGADRRSHVAPLGVGDRSDADGTAPAGATAYYYARLGGPGAAERLIAFRRAGVLRWAGLDHLTGTVRTADAAVAPLDQQRYLPFGGSRDGAANLATDRLFTGQTRDDATGLSRAWAHIYLDNDNNLVRVDQQLNPSVAFGREFAPSGQFTVTQDPSTKALTVGWSLQNGVSTMYRTQGEELFRLSQADPLLAPLSSSAAATMLASSLLASIDGQMTLIPTDGRWLLASLERDPFPRLEAYQYQNGQYVRDIATRYEFGEVIVNGQSIYQSGTAGPLIGLSPAAPRDRYPD